MSVEEDLVNCTEQDRIRYKTVNGLLLKIYGQKEGNGIYRRDKYGNYCYSNQRTKNREAVEKFLCTDVLDNVKRKDPRFSGKVHGVGSCFAGVSVGSNEADLLLMIEVDGVLEEEEENPGYAKYRLSDQALKCWGDCSTDDGYLMSRKLATLFYHHVEKALQSGLHKHLPFAHNGDCPNVSLSGIGTVATTLTVTYKQSDPIDVDFVVAISCQGLPSIASAAWLKGNAKWPNSETVAKIKASGYQLVSKAPYPLNEDEHSVMWRISFSLAETMLLQNIEESIGFSSKICFVLVKYFNMCFLAPRVRDKSPIMKSYYLKVLWLHECQKYPDEDSWTSDKMAERFLSIYKQVYIMINEGQLSDFFMPSVNVMTYNINGTKRQIKQLLDDPVKTFEEWFYDQKYAMVPFLI